MKKRLQACRNSAPTRLVGVPGEEPNRQAAGLQQADSVQELGWCQGRFRCRCSLAVRIVCPIIFGACPVSGLQPDGSLWHVFSRGVLPRVVLFQAYSLVI